VPDERAGILPDMRVMGRLDRMREDGRAMQIARDGERGCRGYSEIYDGAEERQAIATDACVKRFDSFCAVREHGKEVSMI
jgi:hypothetical protein